MTLQDLQWNYYIYNVVNLATEETYETDNFYDAESVFTEWKISNPFDKIVVQKIHSVARRVL